MKKTQQEAPGNYVTVNGHKIHVFASGQGTETLVFLAGHGTSCPTLDFKPLWRRLSKEYKIAVVERAGYGWSQITNVSRDLDMVLEETRRALKLSDIAAPFILLPHSMSGLEAIYWAQKYPKEIKAIIGLDSAIPEVYDTFKIHQAAVSVLGIMTKIGIHKPFVRLACKKEPAIQSGCLSKSEINTLIYMMKEKMLTRDMVNEGKYLKQNAGKVKKRDKPLDTPICVFLSNQSDKNIPNWTQLITEYISDFKMNKYIILDCGHYIHACEPKKIAGDIEDFISNIKM